MEKNTSKRGQFGIGRALVNLFFSPVALYLILFVVFFVIFLYLKLNIAGQGSFGLNVLRSVLSDTCLFTLICLILPGRSRYLIFPFTILTGVLVIVNRLYFSNFFDLIPSSFYFSTIGFNSMVLKSAYASLKPSDISIFIVSFLPLMQLCFLGNQRFVSFKMPKFSILIDIVVLMGSYGSFFYSWSKSASERGENISFIGLIQNSYSNLWNGWRTVYDRLNFTNYIINCLICGDGYFMTLNEEQTKEIESYLMSNSKKNEQVEGLTTSNLKNIIYIVVESLPSKLVEIEESEEIIPCTKSLLRDSSTLYFKALSLSRSGGSSDAQFVYNTGLLPLRDEALVLKHGQNDFPSLAKAFNGYSLEVIGESPRLWNHGLTNKSYGYKGFISDIKTGDIVNTDSIIFEKAKDEINKIKQPFYLFLTTLYMHEPYDYEGDMHKYKLGQRISDKFSGQELEYFERTRLFDEALESFIGYLKQIGLYADTLIVIVGDHPIRSDGICEELQDDSVPVIILNSPLTKVAHRTYTQADLFPTILSIMGLKYSYNGIDYTGVGTNVFTDSVSPTTMPDEEAFRISEMVIRQKP